MYILPPNITVFIRMYDGRILSQSNSSIAQETSRPFTSLDSIQGQVNGTGAGFIRVFRFSVPIVTPPTAPHASSSLLSGASTLDQIVTGIRSGLSLTPPQEI
jgi:hypothetical protein